MTLPDIPTRIERDGEGDRVADIRDHPRNAYKVSTTVFLEGMKNTSINLARSEHLFVLTDKGVEEAPHPGPDEVLIVTEHFGCWPVVAIVVRHAHVSLWRDLPQGVHEAMMRRVRARIANLTPPLSSPV